MIRLGKFDKQGYKDSFSKGELAKELVCMNNDYDKLEKENQKYKEVINKAIKHVSSLSSRGRDCMIYADVKKDILDILKEVEYEKN